MARKGRRGGAGTPTSLSPHKPAPLRRAPSTRVIASGSRRKTFVSAQPAAECAWRERSQTPHRKDSDHGHPSATPARWRLRHSRNLGLVCKVGLDLGHFGLVLFPLVRLCVHLLEDELAQALVVHAPRRILDLVHQLVHLLLGQLKLDVVHQMLDLTASHRRRGTGARGAMR
eukprot:1923798-Prymnesium_polylepis.2